MAKRRRRAEPDEDVRIGAKIPPPIPDPTGYHESLGRWLDNLAGDARHHRRALEHVLQFVDTEDLHEDPLPVEPSPPLPSGTEHG